MTDQQRVESYLRKRYKHDPLLLSEVAREILCSQAYTSCLKTEGELASYAIEDVARYIVSLDKRKSKAIEGVRKKDEGMEESKKWLLENGYAIA